MVKNDHEGLEITARSVISQVSTDFEWVIVHSSSDEKSLAKLDALREISYVRVFEQEPKGIYSAMNYAAENATGQWLWFINAGDMFLSTDSISYIANYLSKSSRCGILACTVIQLTRLGYFYGLFVPSVIQLGDYKVANLHHQGSVISSEQFFRCGMYDETLNLAADGKMLDAILVDNSVLFSERALVGFKLGGRSGISIRKTLDEIATYRPVDSFTTKRVVTKNFLRLLILRFENHLLIQLYLHFREKKILQDFCVDKLMLPDLGVKTSYRRGMFFELIYADGARDGT